LAHSAKISRAHGAYPARVTEMACETPGDRSMVTGVMPRKLPPVVTCAPDGTERTVTRASAAPSWMGPMLCGVPATTTTLDVHRRRPGDDTCTRRMPASISTFDGVTPTALPSTSICAPDGTELMLTTAKFGLSAILSFWCSPAPVMLRRST